VPLTVEEMNFLSLTFTIEIIKKPKLKMYWTDHPVFGTPFFSPQNNAMQTVSRHLIQQEEIPATPHSGVTR
jgi:hypothetical protein